MSGSTASAPDAAPATEITEAVRAALSGKGMGDENFPVASALLARRHRPVVAAYYRFARTADDVADSETLTPDVKVAALDVMQAVLEGREDPALSPEAATLRPMLHERCVPLRVASDLLIAFRDDSRGLTCRTWSDLIAYCENSANPVGRFLLRLHGAPDAADRPSDALCTALQILNHLQDLREDWTRLHRLYLPLEWIESAGGHAEDLARIPTPDLFRPLILEALDRTDALIAEADRLPGHIGERGLTMQARMVVELARRLSTRLRPDAPETEDTKASRIDWAAAALRGAWSGLGGRP
ncbi:squalene/phytoene synthase family protein [Caenispirillum salinarum]|uniref:squalene/phytoene synthase family protein n=1 Tax=Caenispirillum salinarum TaxID=859058 RepID=UPI00384F4DDE